MHQEGVPRNSKPQMRVKSQMCPKIARPKQKGLPSIPQIPSFPAHPQDRCQSGLMSTLGKRVWVKAHRGFESLPVRQYYFNFVTPPL